MSQSDATQPSPPSSADDSASKDNSGMGWKIATGVLAVVAAGALIWGVTATNDLQSQVDDLNATISEQSEAGEQVVTVADAQISVLELQVAALQEAFKELAKQSEAVLDAVGTEYQALEAQLKTTEEALAALQQEKANTEATAAEVGAAYDTAEKELAATQQALVDLLTAVSEEVAAQQ
jgi:chromosome segregation ATPase